MDVQASQTRETHAPHRREKNPDFVWDIPGFGPETRISTNFGEVPAKLLHERDRVRIANGSFKQIKWMKRIGLDADFMSKYPQANPIVIQAGAFGQGVPARDVTVSPHQEIQLRGLKPDESARLVADLEGRAKIMRKPVSSISYTLFHLGEPQLVRSEGLWALTRP
jgi:hypothetical protein